MLEFECTLSGSSVVINTSTDRFGARSPRTYSGFRFHIMYRPITTFKGGIVFLDQNGNQGNERVFSPEELSEFNGKGGKPAYVAVDGIVYDVSGKAAWAVGNHFAGLQAGNDLSEVFASCHRGMSYLLEQLPVVGRLEP